MSPQDVSFEKPIFSATVVADVVGIHPRTLRIYEEQGLVEPGRGPGNEKLYSQRDIQRIRVIRALTQGLGVELTAVRVILGILDELENHGLSSEEILKNVMDKLKP